MSEDAYLFEGTLDGAELERLRMLEATFDDKSQRWLRSTGPLLGLRCLEVGAGAGSIARWLAGEVGANGQVVAIDMNTRFLRDLPREVRVIEGDLGASVLPAETFDLVHARYVLIHNREAGPVVDAMLRALKPGGTLVPEEPDFSAATAFTGAANLRRAFDNVRRAIEKTFSARGMDYGFGSALPELLENRTALLQSLEYDCPVASGGEKLAKMMRLSTLALRAKYVATQLASDADIDGYAEFALSPNCWANYYATVRAVARKPPS